MYRAEFYLPWGIYFPLIQNIKITGIFYQWYNFFLKFLKRKCMTSNTKIILGVLAAAAAGAAIGILLAPEKGSELRRKIKTGFDEVMEDVAELLAVGKEEMKNMYAGAKEEVQQELER
jgi:predicted PurR-regulated permease PerM